MPRFNPAMAPQTGIMAMRMGAGGPAEGVAPVMQTATTSGWYDAFSCVVLFCCCHFACEGITLIIRISVIAVIDFLTVNDVMMADAFLMML